MIINDITCKGWCRAWTLATMSGLNGVGSAYMSDKKAVNNTQQGTATSKIIEDQFEYILLSTKDNENKDPKKDTFKLEGWIEGDKESLNLVDQLKKKCSELSGSIVYDDEKALYYDLTKYSTKGVTVKDQAEKEKLKLLSVESTTGGVDWDAWKKSPSQKVV